MKFQTLDDAVQDAERLLVGGYNKAGNWTLAQCCGHLTNWIRYPMDGYPATPLLLKPIVTLMRLTIGKKFRQSLFSTEAMAEQIRTLPVSVPAADAQDAEAVTEFRQTVERWKAFRGPVIPSPLLGVLTLDEANKVQLIHCAHHLSFLRPLTTPASDRPV